MSTIKLQRPHTLSPQESKALAEKLLNKLVSKYGGDLTQNDQEFRYKHSLGVNALVEANESEFLINIKLGLMARALGPKVEGDMNTLLDKYLA